MLTPELLARADRAATDLGKNGGKWEQSVARRIRRIVSAEDGGPSLEDKDRLTPADVNHVRMSVNYLRWMAEAWSAATEPHADEVARDLKKRLGELTAYQQVITDLMKDIHAPSA